jgi:hypothetical protein
VAITARSCERSAPAAGQPWSRLWQRAVQTVQPQLAEFADAPVQNVQPPRAAILMVQLRAATRPLQGNREADFGNAAFLGGVLTRRAGAVQRTGLDPLASTGAR